MCSFLFSTKYKNENIKDLNYYLKFRGPDKTTINYINNNLFIHNLLSITGSLKAQPYEDKKINLIYNGEIYNYKQFGNYSSDGECLIPLYKQYGSSFIKKLDGEFAICLVDYEKQILILSSDIFKTKPLFFSLDNDSFGCSTYKTPLEKLNYKNIQKVSPNTIYTICLKSYKILNLETIYNFDLTQHKKNYDDWIIAFENAIKKRTNNTNKKIFIGLSSGYDSGLIFNELIKNNIDFYSYTLLGTENENIISERLKINDKNHLSIIKNNHDYIFSNLIIKNRTELFKYTIKSDSTSHTDYISLHQDEGSNNFATICKQAQKNKCKICLSGTGSDEIISDYGFNGEKFYPHSNFGGKFPDDLSKIFPWGSFYNSTLESYVAKEEYVGGAFGIEMRYPFLDKDVVQEFLWLHQDFKNKEYKAPIDYYFTKNNFPYSKLEKLGF
jgi:asparagine synthetase B (glutamine-hydrolysing)